MDLVDKVADVLMKSTAVLGLGLISIGVKHCLTRDYKKAYQAGGAAAIAFAGVTAATNYKDEEREKKDS